MFIKINKNVLTINLYEETLAKIHKLQNGRKFKSIIDFKINVSKEHFISCKLKCVHHYKFDKSKHRYINFY